jgi:hypothetical protein
MANKIQLPAKTKTAAMFAVISAIFTFAIFLLLAIYGFGGNFLRTAYRFWPLMIIAIGHIFVASALFNFLKIGWYAGLSMFFLVFYIFTKMSLTIGGYYVDGSGIYIFMELANAVFIIILFLDRKNYFVAVEEAKKAGGMGKI